MSRGAAIAAISGGNGKDTRSGQLARGGRVGGDGGEDADRQRLEVDDLIGGGEVRTFGFDLPEAEFGLGAVPVSAGVANDDDVSLPRQQGQSGCLDAVLGENAEDDLVRLRHVGQQAVGLWIAKQIARALRENDLAVALEDVGWKIEGVVTVEQNAPRQQGEGQLSLAGRSIDAVPRDAVEGLIRPMRVETRDDRDGPLPGPFEESANVWDDLGTICNRNRTTR